MECLLKIEKYLFFYIGFVNLFLKSQGPVVILQFITEKHNFESTITNGLKSIFFVFIFLIFMF